VVSVDLEGFPSDLIDKKKKKNNMNRIPNYMK